MTRNVIRDGQTRCGHVEAVSGLHDSLSFEYRPMLAETVEAVEAAAAKVSTADGVQMIARETEKHLVNWSEQDGKGDKLPINFEHVRRLPFLLLNKLYRIVAGLVPTDAVPDASTDDVERRLDEIRQLTEGTPPVAALEEEAKN